MIFWDDFDKRITKVVCDQCHNNITSAAKEALKPSLAKRLRAYFVGIENDPCQMESQRSFKFRNREYVLTIFKYFGYKRDGFFSQDGLHVKGWKF